MRCWYCERRCELRDGGTGVCGMYTEHNGEVVERFPDQWSSYHAMIDDAMPGQKVALIVIEGIGAEDFKLPYKPCCNKLDWYIYEHLESQYLAMTTGKHFQYQRFPPVFKFFQEDHENKKYPFSGSHPFLPQDTIGRRKDIRSAAVGTRGMVTHVASGADVSIECFARNLSNFGTIAIILFLLSAIWHSVLELESIPSHPG